MMSVYGDQLRKEAMLKMANDQTYNPLLATNALSDSSVAMDPSALVPLSTMAPPVSAPINSEQMRHQAVGLQNALATKITGAPPAPPLGGGSPGADPAAAGGSVPDMLRRPLSPEEQAAILPTDQLARSEIARGTQDENMSKTEMLRNALRAEKGGREEEAGAKALADIKGKKAIEQNAVDQEAVNLAKQQEAQQARIAMQGQMAADAQMKRVMSAADEASNASLHNFWQDRGTGARILGVLSQTFAGAANGLAGNPSAPTPLDRIIDRDMQMQMANLNQKNQKLQNERGVLKDLYEKTGNAMQATSAMYVAAWKRIDLQGQQLASKYGTQEAQAGYQQLHGITEQRISQLTDRTYAQLHATAVQEFQHGSNLLAETDALSAKQGAPAVGENAKIYHLAGVSGAVDERTYKNFKDEDQNYRGFTKQAEHVDWLFKHGSGDNGADWKDYNGARSSMFATLRQMQKTGAALSDAELANAEKMLPSLAEGEVPGIAWLTNARNQMKRIMATASRGHFSILDGTVDGVKLDPNDIKFGHHVRNYVRAQAEEAAARQRDEGDQ